MKDKNVKRIRFLVMAAILLACLCSKTLYAGVFASLVGKRVANFSSKAYTVPTGRDYECVWYTRGRGIEKLGVDSGIQANANGWYAKAKAKGLATGWELANDSVACFNGGTYGHVIYVEEVDGDQVYYTEANVDGGIGDGKMSPSDGVVKVCSRGTFMAKKGGSYQGSIYLGSGGADYGNQDGRYPSPINAYAMASGRVTTYSSPGGGQSGYISGNTDECIIQKIYDSGWIQVNYPVSGGRKTAYCTLSEFINGGNPYQVSASSNINVYKRSDRSEKYGTVYAGDIIWAVANAGDSLQIIYPTSSGYKMGWVRSDTVDGGTQGGNSGNLVNGYSYPIKTMTLSTNRVTTYVSPGGGQSGYISGNEDECEITAVYDNGWAEVCYPTSNGMKTAYCKWSEFQREGSRYQVYASADITTYKRPDLSESYGTIYPADTMLAVAKEGSSLQVIYPVTSGYKMAWIQASNVSVIKKDNIGHDFYAVIANKFTGTMLTNQRNNVDACKELKDMSQIWHFIKNSDGTYKILSMADQLALDVNGALSDPETNVQVYADNNTNAQKWVIQKQADGYYISPVCGQNSVLDLFKGDAADHTNVQIYPFHGREAQTFYINPVNLIQEIKAESQNIKLVVGETYELSQNIKFSPENAYCSQLKYESKETKVAAVSATGTLQAVGIGKTTIQLHSVDGSNKKESIVIEVQEKPEDKPVQPEDQKTIVTMEKIEAQAGAIIEIPVKIANNKGLMGMSLHVAYSAEVMEQPDVKAGDVLSAGRLESSITEETKDQFKILWNNSEEIMKEGILFYLSFRIKEECPQGSYPIVMNFNEEDTFNENYQTVSIEEVQGIIEISEVSSVVYGDVNQDALINNKDVAMLLRYLVGREKLSEIQIKAADANKDNAINNKDAAKIARYLVGKEQL